MGTLVREVCQWGTFIAAIGMFPAGYLTVASWEMERAGKRDEGVAKQVRIARKAMRREMFGV